MFAVSPLIFVADIKLIYSYNLAIYGRIANHIQKLYYDVKIFKVVMENVLNKIPKIKLSWLISHTCKPLIYK